MRIHIHPDPRSHQLLKTKTFIKSTAIRRNGNTQLQPGYMNTFLWKSFVHTLTILLLTGSRTSRHPHTTTQQVIRKILIFSFLTNYSNNNFARNTVRAAPSEKRKKKLVSMFIPFNLFLTI